MIDFRIQYICATQKEDFEVACAKLINKLKTAKNLFKVTFFINADTDDAFIIKKNLLKQAVTRQFGISAPALTFVSQKPLSCFLAAEYFCFNTASYTLQHKKTALCNYLVVADEAENKMLLVTDLEGQLSDSISVQCTTLLKETGEIFKQEGFDLNTIIRQWNYIPGITQFEDGIQNYQAFNDARTLLFNQTQWINGYPAATGIGTQYGGVHIDLMAMQGHVEIDAIQNKEQTDAHCYSKDVLEGDKTGLLSHKSTPKFERAKLISGKSSSLLFISGTAAIKGEANYYKDDAAMQTNLTLDHIEELISAATELKNKETGPIQAMRVYIKKEEHFNMIKNVCQQRYPDTPTIYLLSDVCRDELLVEIEGLVN